MGKHFLWVVGGSSGKVEVYFGWVALVGHFLWVGGGERG